MGEERPSSAIKRSKFERERDLAIVSTMYLKGVTQQMITDYLNKEFYSDRPLSRQAITYDVKVLIRSWRRDAFRDIDERLAEELNKVNLLERVYWEAWEKTNSDKMLQGVQWCIDKRCGIFGLNAPLKIAQTDPTGKQEYSGGVTDEERATRILELLGRVQQVGVGPAVGIDDTSGPAGQ